MLFSVLFCCFVPLRVLDKKKKRKEIEKQFLHLAFSQRAGKSVRVEWRKWLKQRAALSLKKLKNCLWPFFNPRGYWNLKSLKNGQKF